MADEHIVRLRNVTKVYGSGRTAVRALSEVTLDVPRGALVVLLGPSGSGKTTLMNLVGGLDRPTSGEIIVEGRDIAKLGDEELTEYRRQTVGFVFQFFNLVPTLTALENVELVGELSQNPGHAAELLERVGLGEHLHHYPGQLSGGEQQRVAIARALVKRPRLLLADEPTGNLDYETGVLVLETIWRINREDGVTVMMVTHNNPQAEMADIVVRLRSGSIAELKENKAPAQPKELKW